MIKKIGLIIGIVVIMWAVSYIETVYTRQATVCEINKQITFIDGSGHLWKFTDDNNYTVGEKVKLKMSTNGTDSYIKDDLILSVKRM